MSHSDDFNPSSAFTACHVVSLPSAVNLIPAAGFNGWEKPNYFIRAVNGKGSQEYYISQTHTGVCMKEIGITQ